MPLYEYDCAAHGVFEAHRALRDFDDGAPCPVCGDPSSRILSVPSLRTSDGAAGRVARDRNERSQHEPALATRAPPSVEAPRLQASTGGLPWAVGH